MNTIKLEARSRDAGKKTTREIRQSGHVPCVLYGRGQDPVLFQLARLEMRGLVFTDEMNRIELTVGKKSFDCVIKDVDFHPLTDEPVHADFVALQEGQKIKLSIPIQYSGKAVGKEEGGEVEVLMHDLDILCLPKDIPDHVEVDVTPLNIGDTLHVSDLDLPNVEILNPERQSLVTVVVPKIEEEPEEEEELLEGELEGEEGAEGEEGEGEQSEEKAEAES